MSKINKIPAYLLSIVLVAGFIMPATASETAPANLGSPTLQTGISGSVFSVPTASPAPGTYASTQNVVLSAPGATNIRYTTDGSAPTCQSGTVYSAAIAVANSLSIKAVSCAAGLMSPVQTFTYAINITQPSAPSSGGSSSVSTGGSGSSRYVAPLTTNLQNATIKINAGDASTYLREVELTLGATGATKMLIANNSAFTGSVWQDYRTTAKWQLSTGYGLKTVYVKFRDASDGESAVVSDTIQYLEANANNEETKSTAESVKNDSETEDVVVLGVESDWRSIQLENILSEAKYLAAGDVNVIAGNAKQTRNTIAEADTFAKYTKALLSGTKGMSQSQINTITYFILYGTPTTKALGAGERAGVLNSYKAAFGKLPRVESEWTDVLKIANGRWPSETSQPALDRAKSHFKKVYLRAPDMAKSNDNAAVTIIAYGLRTAERNLASEAAAIKIFKSIYVHNPVSAVDWDIVRAIAYSGAKR